MYKYILVYEYLYFRPTDYSSCMEKSRIHPPPVHNMYILMYILIHMFELNRVVENATHGYLNKIP